MPANYKHRIDADNTYFHIYNRGNEGRIIFREESDYDVFLTFIKEYLSPQKNSIYIKKSFTVKGKTYQGIPHQPKNYFNKIELVAYNITPTHFHLLIHQISSGSIESFIRSLCTRYSMYFNKKYTHKGAIFEGPYKSVHIEDISQLAKLSSSFHHNSIQENNNLTSIHSSYAEYLGIRNTPWIKSEIILSFYNASKNRNDYQKIIQEFVPDQKHKEYFEHSQPPEASKPDIAHRLSEILQTDEGTLSYSNFFNYTMTIAVFVILFSFGISNVWVSTIDTQVSTSTISPKVAGAEDTAPDNPVVEAISDETKPIAIEAIVTPSPQPDLAEIPIKLTLSVKKDYESVDIYIHESPSTNSKVLSIAKYGDTFEYVSHFSGWYKVKLTDNSFGYILKTLLEEVKGENN